MQSEQLYDAQFQMHPLSHGSLNWGCRAVWTLLQESWIPAQHGWSLGCLCAHTYLFGWLLSSVQVGGCPWAEPPPQVATGSLLDVLVNKMSGSLINASILIARNLLLRHHPVPWLMWTNISEWKTLHKWKMESVNFLLGPLIQNDSKIIFKEKKNNPQHPYSIFSKSTTKFCWFGRSDGEPHVHSRDNMLVWVCFPGFTGTVRVSNYSRRVNKGICNLVPAGNLFQKCFTPFIKHRFFILSCFVFS